MFRLQIDRHIKFGGQDGVSQGSGNWIPRWTILKFQHVERIEFHTTFLSSVSPNFMINFRNSEHPLRVTLRGFHFQNYIIDFLAFPNGSLRKTFGGRAYTVYNFSSLLHSKVHILYMIYITFSHQSAYTIYDFHDFFTPKCIYYIWFPSLFQPIQHIPITFFIALCAFTPPTCIYR